MLIAGCLYPKPLLRVNKIKKDIMMRKIILASASPRRRELLSQIGMDFEVITSSSDEIITKENPCEIVMELAEGKAREVYDKVITSSGDKQVVVIGADTIVVHNGRIMGKPTDENDAIAMLTELCGDIHQVYTGVAFLWNEDGRTCKHTFYECTDVHVSSATEEEIRAYVDTKDPMDKAGAYGIQGRFAAFIEKINGDYNNVVGLPVGRVYREMKSKNLY